MTSILHDLTPSALVTAIEANLFEFSKLFRRWPRAEVFDSEEMLCSVTDLPFALFNSVLRANLAPGRVDTAIEDAISRCRSKKVPMRWWTGPATRPVDLGQRLEEHGFTHFGDSPGMAADLLALNDDVPAPAGLSITEVADMETLSQACHVTTIGFKMPGLVETAWRDLIAAIGFGSPRPVRLYLGRLNGEPMATSLLFLEAGVAGIYNVTTLPEARRRGLGAAITAFPLRHACAEGYRVAILHSSPMGLNVYRQLGFREYCTIGHYIRASDRERAND
jgi:GNAT superfamily N-acetyltransferase